MPTTVNAKQQVSQRDMLMWAVLGTVAAALFATFWSVCESQVERARTRDESTNMQRVAISDCLSYMPRSTYNTCANGGESPLARPQAATNVPVNFTFR